MEDLIDPPELGKHGRQNEGLSNGVQPRKGLTGGVDVGRGGIVHSDRDDAGVGDQISNQQHDQKDGLHRPDDGRGAVPADPDREAHRQRHARPHEREPHAAQVRIQQVEIFVGCALIPLLNSAASSCLQNYGASCFVARCWFERKL